ncbi:MAG: HRDC domain-containing protein, partial [Burkholderiaceae bacterium]|nr:HRDC domain-containing protein [Burkholderiaceae bacterium]
KLKPKTPEALMSVSGVGEKKFERYADAIFSMVAEY